MVSGVCRFLATGLVLSASAGTTACTVTWGTGPGAAPAQPVYYVGSNGVAPPAPPPQQVQPQAPTAPAAPTPVEEAPTPVFTSYPTAGGSTGPRRVNGGGGVVVRGGTGMPVLARGSVFGGDGTTFHGTLYFIPVGSPHMPNFASYGGAAVTFTDHFNIPLTNSQGSLPPWPDKVEGFGFEYLGNFTATKAGTYDFIAYSDDGAIVYVDGAMVVNDDGIHDPQRADGKVNLTAGVHSLRVDYYLAYRWTVQLQLYVIPPSGNQELVGPQI